MRGRKNCATLRDRVAGVRGASNGEKLKVYRTSIGFFDLAVAAPSMKAAAEAWGSDPDIFRRGFAEETADPKVVAATMASPGVVLRRPVGSQGEFSERAALPKAPEGERKAAPPRGERAKPAERPVAKADEKAKQAAAREKEQAAAREKERERQERERKEAERERARRERENKIAKLNAEFDKARARHAASIEALKQQREQLDGDEAREKERWEAEQRRHKDALKGLDAYRIFTPEGSQYLGDDVRAARLAGQRPLCRLWRHLPHEGGGWRASPTLRPTTRVAFEDKRSGGQASGRVDGAEPVPRGAARLTTRCNGRSPISTCRPVGGARPRR